jgi:HEAT repeat protein
VSGDDPTLVEPIENDLVRAGFANGNDGVALLRTYVKDGDVRRRVLALRGLVRRSLMTDQLWRDSFSDDEPTMRREAVQQFAYVTDVDTTLLDTVSSMLADSDDLVAEGAAFALGEHNYTEAVDPLCVAARTHDDARVREAAIAALGVLGDDRARSTIIEALSDKAPIRRRAIVALANYEGPDIEAALDGAGEDRDWQVRAAVTQLRSDED